MTRQELRIKLSIWCRCGSPETASATLLRLLELYPMYEHYSEFKEWIQDDGIQLILLYLLDDFKWTEHGGSVYGGWLTPLGIDIRNALKLERFDDFETLHKDHCACGYDIDDQTHECV